MRPAPRLDRWAWARGALVAGALAGIVAGTTAAGAGGFVSPTPETQLRSLEFEFVTTQSFDGRDLRKILEQQPRGRLLWLRRILGFLPFVEPPLTAQFDPLELQRDVVRLREFYRHAGFTPTEVIYDVAHDTEDDVVDVRFIVAEGKPFELRALVVRDSTGAAPETWLPADQRDDWAKFLGAELQRHGERLGDAEERAHETAVLDWYRDRGYPYSKVTSSVQRDSTTFTADQHIVVRPGPRARIGRVLVEGNRSVGADVIQHALLVEPGEWYSGHKLQEGQRHVLNLDLFHVVVVDIPPQPQDDTVDVRARVEETKPRLLTGEVGYLSDAGLTVRGDWSHRNFGGGARTFTVTAAGQSGVWALEDIPSRLARLSVALSQPRFLSRRVSLVANPFGEYRDDARDRSWGYGFNTTLIYVGRSWVRNASLQYTIDARDIIELRGGTSRLDFLSELRNQLSQVDHITSSTFTLAGGFGVQDRPVYPQRQLSVRPSLAVTAPSAWSTIEYARADLGVGAIRPFGRRLSGAARVSIGRMFPYGKSAPVSPEIDGLRKFLELRDRVFTAGGGSDVRGWPNRLLGPKFPDIRNDPADSTRLVADRYIPIGGLARLAVSAEARLPFPYLSEAWGTHVFVDGGRVWNPDDRFLGAGDGFDQERFFAATGFGIDRETPVGPLRLSVAWMLNPSQLDVLRAQEFLNALAVGAVDAQTTHWKRRLRLNVSLGIGL